MKTIIIFMLSIALVSARTEESCKQCKEGLKFSIMMLFEVGRLNMKAADACDLLKDPPTCKAGVKNIVMSIFGSIYDPNSKFVEGLCTEEDNVKRKGRRLSIHLPKISFNKPKLLNQIHQNEEILMSKFSKKRNSQGLHSTQEVPEKRAHLTVHDPNEFLPGNEDLRRASFHGWSINIPRIIMPSTNLANIGYPFKYYLSNYLGKFDEQKIDNLIRSEIISKATKEMIEIHKNDLPSSEICQTALLKVEEDNKATSRPESGRVSVLRKLLKTPGPVSQYSFVWSSSNSHERFHSFIEDSFLSGCSAPENTNVSDNAPSKKLPNKIGHVPVIGQSIEVYSTEQSGQVKYDPDGIVVRKRKISYEKLPKEDKKKVLSGLLLKSAIHQSLLLTNSSTASSRKDSFIDDSSLSVDGVTINISKNDEKSFVEHIADQVLEKTSKESSFVDQNFKMPSMVIDPVSLMRAVEDVIDEDSLLKRGNGSVVDFLEPDDPIEYFSRHASFSIPQEINKRMSIPESEPHKLTNNLLKFQENKNKNLNDNSLLSYQFKPKILRKTSNLQGFSGEKSVIINSEREEERLKDMKTAMLAPTTKYQLSLGVPTTNPSALYKKKNIKKSKNHEIKLEDNKLYKSELISLIGQQKSMTSSQETKEWVVPTKAEVFWDDSYDIGELQAGPSPENKLEDEYSRVQSPINLDHISEHLEFVKKATIINNLVPSIIINDNTQSIHKVEKVRLPVIRKTRKNESEEHVENRKNILPPLVKKEEGLRTPKPSAPSIYYGNEMRAKLYDINPPRPSNLIPSPGIVFTPTLETHKTVTPIICDADKDDNAISLVKDRCLGKKESTIEKEVLLTTKQEDLQIFDEEKEGKQEAMVEEKGELYEQEIERMEMNEKEIVEEVKVEIENQENVSDLWNQFNVIKQTSSGIVNLSLLGKRMDQVAKTVLSKTVDSKNIARSKPKNGDFNPQLSMTMWSYKELQHFEPPLPPILVALLSGKADIIADKVIGAVDGGLDLAEDIRAAVELIMNLRPKARAGQCFTTLIGVPKGYKLSLNTIRPGLKEKDYHLMVLKSVKEAMNKSNLQPLLGRKELDALAASISKVAATFASILIGEGSEGAAINFSGLSLETLLTGLIDGSIYGTPLAGKGILAGLLEAAGGGANALIGLLRAAGGGLEGLKKLLGAAGGKPSEALAELIAASGGDAAEVLKRLINEVGGGVEGLKNLLAAMGGGNAEEALRNLLDAAGGGAEGLKNLLKAAGGGVEGLKNLLEALGGGEEALANLIKAAGGGAEGIKNLLQAAGGGIEGLKNLLEAVGGGVEGLKNLLNAAGGKDKAEALKNLISGAGGGLQGLKNLLEAVGGGAEGLKNLLDAVGGGKEGLKNLLEAVGGGVQGLKNLLEAAGGGAEGLRNLLQAVGGGAEGLKNLLEAMGGDTADALKNLISAAGGGAQGLKNLLEAAGGGAEGLRNLLEAAGGGTEGLKNLLKAVGGEDMTKGLANLIAAAGGGSEGLKNLLAAVGGGAEGLKNLLEAMGGADKSEALSNLIKAAGGGKEGLRNLLEAVGGGVEGLKNLLSASDGIEGLLKALGGGADALEALLAAAGDNPEEALRNLINALGGGKEALEALLKAAGGGPDALKKLLESLGGGPDALKKLLEMCGGDEALQALLAAMGGGKEGLAKLLEALGGADNEDALQALINAMGGGEAGLSKLIAALGGGEEGLSNLLEAIGGKQGKAEGLARLLKAAGGGEVGLAALIRAVGGGQEGLAALIRAAGGGEEGLAALIRAAGGGEEGLAALLKAAGADGEDGLSVLLAAVGGGAEGLAALIRAAGGGESGLQSLLRALGGKNAEEALKRLIAAAGGGEEGLAVLMEALKRSGKTNMGGVDALNMLLNAMGGGKEGLEALLRAAGGGVKALHAILKAAGGGAEALNALIEAAGGGAEGLLDLLAAIGADPSDMELLGQILEAAGLDKALIEACKGDPARLAAMLRGMAKVEQMKRMGMNAPREMDEGEREWFNTRPPGPPGLAEKYEEAKRKWRKAMEAVKTEKNAAVLPPMRFGHGPGIDGEAVRLSSRFRAQQDAEAEQQRQKLAEQIMKEQAQKEADLLEQKRQKLAQEQAEKDKLEAEEKAKQAEEERKRLAKEAHEKKLAEMKKKRDEEMALKKKQQKETEIEEIKVEQSTEETEIKTAIKARLAFTHSLMLEAFGLNHTLSITPAFVWSYFELLKVSQPSLMPLMNCVGIKGPGISGNPVEIIQKLMIPT